MRIVLDTTTVVTAVRSSGGAAGELLRKVFQGEVVLLMDLKLSLEYRDVALRAEHVRASGLEPGEVLELLEALDAFSEAVDVAIKLRPLSPDPNDNMVLDLALNGRADVLVTNNTRHFLAAGKRLGIAVLTPAETLHLLEEENPDGH